MVSWTAAARPRFFFAALAPCNNFFLLKSSKDDLCLPCPFEQQPRRACLGARGLILPMANTAVVFQASLRQLRPHKFGRFGHAEKKLGSNSE